MKLKQISNEVAILLCAVENESQLNSMGFECKGHLCDYKGYEEFYERLWVWRKIEDDIVYIVVTVDNGNSYCSLAYIDMYIEELIVTNE